MRLFVSNFYGTTFLVIYRMVIIMGIVLELGAAAAPLLSPSEANAILNSGWWNLSQLDSHNICSWNAISCNVAGSITIIKCPFRTTGNRLATLNPSAFKNLEMLDASYCGLQGTIPPEIGNLPKLTYLDLSWNSLHGEIPPSLANLTKLEMLDISHNLISGSLKPLLVGSHAQLTTIYLRNNSISGKIPPELGYLPFLNSLDLSYNNLSGRVPLSLQNVSYVDLAFNNLNGPIPDGLSEFRLRGNRGVCSNYSYCQTEYEFKPCQACNNKVRHIQHNQLVIVLPILIFLIMVFLLFMYLRHIRIAIKNKHAKTTAATKNGDLFCIWNYDGNIAVANSASIPIVPSNKVIK